MESRSFSSLEPAPRIDEPSEAELKADAARNAAQRRLQDPNTGARLRKNALLSAGLAAAGLFTGGQVLPRVADYRREQTRIEAEHKREREARHERILAAEERHAYLERLHTLRANLITEARQGLEHGTFDFARFQLRASQLDALEDEDRQIDIPAAEAKFERVMTRFREALVKFGNGTDPATIVRALYLATTDYEYHHIDGLTFPDSVTETSGDCKFAAQLYPAILWRHGIHDGVGMRLYAPPPGERIGHRAPAWQVPHPQGGVTEYDLISGGSPYRNDAGEVQGAFLSMSDYIRAYEQWHQAHPVPSLREILDHRPLEEPTTEFALGSDLAGDHLAAPQLAPTRSRSFPIGSPPAGGPLMGVYRSENGRITWQQGHERSEQASIASSRTFTREENLSSMPGPHLDAVQTYRSPRAGDIIYYGRAAEEIDRLLQQEHRPAQQAILLATSLTNWSFFQETWTAQHRPRNAESARRLIRKRQRELHEVLQHVRVEDLLHETHFDDSHEDLEQRQSDLQYNTANILHDHELGWPLLFQLVSRTRLGEANFQGDTFRHLVTILSQLIRTSSAQEEEQLRPLLIRLPLDTRRFLYNIIGDHTLQDPVLHEEQRFSQFITYTNEDQLLELATGVVHAPYVEGMHFNILHRPVIGHTAILWSSFVEIHASIETQVQQRHLDPRWEIIGTFGVLRGIISQLPYNSTIPFTPEEHTAAMSLQGSEAWVRTHAREIREFSPMDNPSRYLQELAQLTRKLGR